MRAMGFFRSRRAAPRGRSTATGLPSEARPRRGAGAVWLAGAVFTAAYGFVTWLVLTEPAHPHDAPAGWSYPHACCSGFDCRPVQLGDSGTVSVDEASGIYTILRTGEVIAPGDTRLKISPDGVTHWCSVAGAEDGRTICLFVPPRAF